MNYNYLILFLFIILIFIINYYKIRNNYISLYILIIITIIIHYNWFYHENKCESFLNNKKNKNECVFNTHKYKYYSGIFWGGCIDRWHISHILLWIIIGLLSPNNYIIVIIISILWEYYEHLIPIYYCNGDYNRFYGRYEDILLNIFGYSIGNLLSYL